MCPEAKMAGVLCSAPAEFVVSEALASVFDQLIYHGRVSQC